MSSQDGAIKVAFIGLGSMGGMMVDGFIKARGLSPCEIVLSTRTKSKLDDARAKWPGIHTAQSNAEAAALARHVFVCVKPGDTLDVLKEIKPVLNGQSHIISIVGSVSMSSIRAIVPCSVSKVGPTVVSEVCAGVSLVCHNDMVTPSDAAFVEELLKGIGGVKRIAESEYEMAIELTSCMPGFISAIFQEMVESSLRHSNTVTREEARSLVLETLLGTAKLLAEKGMTFDETINRVATPGGITEEGVKVFRAKLPAVFDEMFEATLAKRRAVSEKMNTLHPTNASDIPQAIKEWETETGVALFRSMGVTDGSRVLDFGFGQGHFAVAASGAVGPSGVVYALDRDAIAIDGLKRRIAQDSVANIRLVETAGEVRIPLDAGSVDFMMLYDLFHGEGLEAKELILEAKRVLRPGRTLSVLPFHIAADAVNGLLALVMSFGFAPSGDYPGAGPHFGMLHRAYERNAGASFDEVEKGTIHNFTRQ